MTSEAVHIQGVPITAIAEEFDTPLFVYDTDVLRQTYRELTALLPAPVEVFFSLKANPNVSVCHFLAQHGAGAEVSSHAELITALKAGVQPEKILFVGPGKSQPELQACVDTHIAAVVCESLDELQQLEKLSGARDGENCRAILRVNPAFTTKGSGLAMGGKPRQFGVDQDTVKASKALIGELRHVDVVGIHAYMGTRFLDESNVVHNTREILQLAEEIAGELGIPLDMVDFGGGLGVAYFDNENDIDLGELSEGMQEAVTPFAERHPGCRLIMELGRYLTATAGTYVVRARCVKESMGETFVVADGGTNHHMAAVGVGSFVKRNFPVRHMQRPLDQPEHTYNLAGPLCTPNDVLARKVKLPHVAVGDLLGVERSGAYGPSASPGYFLSHGYPVEVMVHQGRAQLVRERDTPADLLRKQRLLDLGDEP